VRHAVRSRRPASRSIRKLGAYSSRIKKMVRTEQAELLHKVFSDADLVDVDCSQWDAAISIFVLADHIPSPLVGKRSLIAVRFLGVTKFEWRFNHVTFTRFPLKTDPHQ